MFLRIAAMAALGIWVYLLLARGRFWRMDVSSAGATRAGSAARVAAVIPARNEAEVIGEAVASLARQQYGGAFHIVVVDDASEDQTPEAARAAAPPERVTIIRGAPLPSGWTGKLWAVFQGIAEAKRFQPDYLLLTDADIVHPPGGLEELVAQAESGYDLVSWMVTLRCESFAERALIPAFVFFFFMLYPPAWIRSTRHKTAGAAGGCMLLRYAMLEQIGGIASIRGELIDDCALARAVKQQGGRVWLGLGAGARSIREYGTFAEIGRMISRTAFTQLRYSAALLALTVAGLAITFLFPVMAALRSSGYGIAAWALMGVAYLPVLRYYRRSMFWAPLLPLVAVFYMGATMHSAIEYWRGRGGMWKGRAQSQRR
ncbi:MAG: glycosyl transferase family 2 [Terriglobia bacterium]|nr:MAG: glycosyl transferase family 2 [Terriglobia bacterium]